MLVDVQTICELHERAVVRWHQEPVDNPYQGFLGLVCQQHQFNYLLWHQEDIARSPQATDAQIAQVKRSIDRYNQSRNDAIERLDDAIMQTLESRGVKCSPDAPHNSETPGSIIDRMSILALRIYHLNEQLERTDASLAHLQIVAGKLQICNAQQHDLKTALYCLLDDLFAGRKQHRIYRHCKMYNDPAMNPYLNGQKTTVAA